MGELVPSIALALCTLHSNSAFAFLLHWVPTSETEEGAVLRKGPCLPNTNSLLLKYLHAHLIAFLALPQSREQLLCHLWSLSWFFKNLDRPSKGGKKITWCRIVSWKTDSGWDFTTSLFGHIYQVSYLLYYLLFQMCAVFFFFSYIYIFLFIYGCIGSSLLWAGFL